MNAFAIYLFALTLAPAPPSFAGTWSPVVSPPGSAGSGGGTASLPPSDIVIRQTPTALSIDRKAFGQVTTQVLTLDGSENTNKSGATVSVTRSHWQGSKLVTVGKTSQTTSQGYDEWTVKETRYLNARGQLVVESEFTAQDGKVTAGTQTFVRRP